MSMPNNGLNKLIEECGELLQIAGIKLSNMESDEAPGRDYSLKATLEDEMADLAAATGFVIEKLGLDVERMRLRAEGKLARYRLWDKRDVA